LNIDRNGARQAPIREPSKASPMGIGFGHHGPVFACQRRPETRK